MFALIVMTIGTLAVAYTAAVLIDCSVGAFELVWTDPLALCAAFDAYGLGGDPLVGLGLALFSLLAVFATWIPVLKRHRRRKRIEPDRSLAENIGRISPTTGDETSVDGDPREAPQEIPEVSSEDPIEEPVDRHGQLVEALIALEAQLDSPEGLSREATSSWMQLLREVNQLHNDGSLPTEEFKAINTRLLDLVGGPSAVSINS